MTLKIPRLRGRTLTAVRRAAEAPATGAALRQLIARGLGLDQLGRLPAMWRGELPLDARPLEARQRRADVPPAPLPYPTTGAWPHSAAAYTARYQGGALTPRAVAERALHALGELARRSPTMNLLAAEDAAQTLRDADAATERYRSGAARGPLDGVPFLVKDELDIAGLPTRFGSRAEPDTPAAHDATVVARLRRAGAVFIGKTVLTEWGMSPIGANRGQPMPHNAHDPSRAPGGSSTGAAVGVALGLAPISVGGDGGGSIRIPAALNGAGDGFKGSVAHVGPLGASTQDLAWFLDAVASEVDPDDALTAWAPPPPEGGFGAALGRGVRGLRIGVDDDEWRDASAEVAEAGRAALAALEREGAKLVAVKLPIARHAAKIGYLTIGPESLALHRSDWLDRRALINDDTRLSFAVLAGFSALEQLDAQRLRTGLRLEVARVLGEVDVLALPTTAITAPPYSEEDARLGFSDPVALDGLCRFAFLANLTGLPAASAPVGVDSAGLPIGLQILGDAWDEAGVLAVLAHLERVGVAAARRPRGGVELLG
jgi:aspartyl-tRNA(Asn)/glutamyl-tRNA(Gln) amidotransferase subunit A